MIRRTTRSIVGCVGAFAIVADDDRMVGAAGRGDRLLERRARSRFPPSADSVQRRTRRRSPSPRTGIVADVNGHLRPGLTHHSRGRRRACSSLALPARTSVLIADETATTARSTDVEPHVRRCRGHACPMDGIRSPAGSLQAHRTEAPSMATVARASASVRRQRSRSSTAPNPSGTWSLYVYTTTLLGDSGTISGGWSLSIALASVASFSPDERQGWRLGRPDRSWASQEPPP